LGNNRVVFSPRNFLANGDVIKTVHFAADYYPYGKTLRYFETSTFEEKYLTTQHERDRETGFDYRGARYYDSDLGRFLSLDPLAAKFPEWSAYNYVLGNPIMLIDPDGREPEDWIKNLATGQYFWESSIFSPVQALPEGYQYIGKSGEYESEKGTVLLNDGGSWNFKVEGNIAVANKTSNSSSKSANSNISPSFIGGIPQDYFVGVYGEFSVGGGIFFQADHGFIWSPYTGFHTYFTDHSVDNGFNFRTELASIGIGGGAMFTTGDPKDVRKEHYEGSSIVIDINASAVFVDAGQSIAIIQPFNKKGERMIFVGAQVSGGEGTPYASGGFNWNAITKLK
jgi:RHS repeat-associated protein